MLEVKLDDIPDGAACASLRVLLDVLAQTQGPVYHGLCDGQEGCNCCRVVAVRGAIRRPFGILIEGCVGQRWVEIPWRDE